MLSEAGTSPIESAVAASLCRRTPKKRDECASTLVPLRDQAGYPDLAPPNQAMITQALNKLTGRGDRAAGRGDPLVDREGPD